MEKTMEKSDCRFTYLRTEPPKVGHRGFPIACIATEYDRVLNKAYVGVSVVHPKDQSTRFSKPLARRIAKERIELRPIVVDIATLNTRPTASDILWSVMKVLESDMTLPSRVRRAISAWLLRDKAIKVAKTANAIISSKDLAESVINASIKQVKETKPLKNPFSYHPSITPSILPSKPLVQMGF